MAETDSWLRAERGGTKRASLISKPEVLAALIQKAQRPLFIVGHEALLAGPEGESMIAFITSLQEMVRIPVLSTAHTAGELISRGIKPAVSMGSMEIADRLRDPSWKGLDGKGQYDLVLITGIPYSISWVLFSGLKQGAPKTKVVNLDPKYHPNATWSFGNLRTKDWQDVLIAVTQAIETIKEGEE